MLNRDDIEELARRVERLSPSHRDPERFHIDKSEIVNELMRLAEQASIKPSSSARIGHDNRPSREHL